MASTVGRIHLEEIEVGSGDPMEIFHSWFQDAKDQKCNVLPEQAALAAQNPDGHPTAVNLLLGGYDRKGFRLHMGTRSRQAAQPQSSSHTTVVFAWFFWDNNQGNLGSKQVRIEGILEAVSVDENGEHIISGRSRTYQLSPTTIEFYKERRNSIPDRIRFRKVEGADYANLAIGTFLGSNCWVYERLEP